MIARTMILPIVEIIAAMTPTGKRHGGFFFNTDFAEERALSSSSFESGSGFSVEGFIATNLSSFLSNVN